MCNCLFFDNILDLKRILMTAFSVDFPISNLILIFDIVSEIKDSV
jgi:hypothetical protein